MAALVTFDMGIYYTSSGQQTLFELDWQMPLPLWLKLETINRGVSCKELGRVILSWCYKNLEISQALILILFTGANNKTSMKINNDGLKVTFMLGMRTWPCVNFYLLFDNNSSDVTTAYNYITKMCKITPSVDEIFFRFWT